jgi:DNA-binding transcriptional LysR family regulator
VALDALARHGVVPCSLLEVGSTEMIRQVVVAGMGVAIVSAAAVADSVDAGKLVVLAVRGFAVSRMLSSLSLPDRQPSPAAGAFGRLLESGGLGSAMG